VNRDVSFSQAFAFPRLRRGMVHLIDKDLCAVGIAKSKRVESGAKDDDLPNPSFDSSRQSIFRNPASRRGEQTPDAGQRVRGGKLQHVLLLFAQNCHGKWVMEDCAMIEHLMSSSLTGNHQGCAVGFIKLHFLDLRRHP
jgi:hypothetical protein